MIKCGANEFVVRRLWRQSHTNRKGDCKASTIYDTATDAENSAFEYRYNLESKLSK